MTTAEFQTTPRPDVLSETRPLYWSIRRELWENRSIYLAPLIVAGIVLFATLISNFSLPDRVRKASALDPAKRRAAIVQHVSMVPAPIMLTTFIVAVFYCLDALYGERRDRSILFWKSLPVSDRTVVLSKIAIPVIVLPAIALGLSVIVQLVLLQASSGVLMASGLSPGLVWSELHFFEGLVIMVYGLGVHVLWFLPIYAWLMLVSAWARRAPFLWAVLPPLAIAAIERIVSSKGYFLQMLMYRMGGAMKEAFVKLKPGTHDFERLSQLDPIRFFTAPGFWVGLIFAGGCFAAAIRLRRYREPI